MRKILSLVACTSLLFFNSLSSERISPALTSGPPVPGYELVWADEFNGRTLDTEKWDFRKLGPRKNGVNVKSALSLNGRGKLRITTRKNGDIYETSMIGTEGKFETKYGYFECRAKLQKEVGHHSAFWLYTPTVGDIIGNPAESGAEIDIFEYLRRKGDTVQHTIHWDGYKKNIHKFILNRPVIPGLSKGWHTFGLLWTEDEYIFYVDGQETWRTNQSVSNRSQYMILSLEVTKWSGDISQAKLPDSLYVDYVRVYKKINQ